MNVLFEPKGYRPPTQVRRFSDFRSILRIVSSNSDVEYRGLSTDRGLISEGESYLTREPIIKELQIEVVDLIGKKVLDVCVGGGKSVKEARAIGIDYTGIDIMPAVVDRGGTDELARSISLNITSIKKKLREINSLYPRSIVAADATKSLPFQDNKFDTVLSCYGVPDYSQNPTDAVTSMLEMIRVARETVIFSGGWDKDNSEGIVDMGRSFKFPLKRFLDHLKLSGVTYEIKECIDRLGHIMRSVHLNVHNKNPNFIDEMILLFQP